MKYETLDEVINDKDFYLIDNDVKQYKFRAECLFDIIGFLKLSGEHEIHFTIESSNKYPDCICTIYTNASLDQIQDIFNSVPNSHVMKETIALASEYTGERA